LRLTELAAFPAEGAGRFAFRGAGRCFFAGRLAVARLTATRFLVRLRPEDALDAFAVAFFPFRTLRLAM